MKKKRKVLKSTFKNKYVKSAQKVKDATFNKLDKKRRINIDFKKKLKKKIK